ncbi:Alpha-acetolactate decarboxylase [Legionella massiliensis]|uniref:Alpha-acetolactate decarboxylase n=1 Tax=Legionella massiliensis TaxID=1034943 RepID=A0A078KYX3_9GAMM|nr:acetolactate decarboxylase [Legionella massiliensis]CDZ76954.1 Alpha-acetolactate decarboxylase [Legionella massiliensis]CEE12692.1 Alpha-acetolactate decarboxylase [Legionella massiliensis]
MSCSNKTLFQVGVLCGFLNKVYEGEHSLAQIMKKGNMGIGTFDSVHGELIGLDGQFYRIIEDGIARPVDPEQKSPFAWVIDFEETQQFVLENIQSFEHFSEEFDQRVSSPNYIYAYRFECLMEEMECRSEACQPKPFQPLVETMADVQVNFSYSNINAMVAGFYFPSYMATINIPGHHMHFVDPTTQKGGHVFGFSFKKALIKVCCIKNFELALIESETFEKLDTQIDNMKEATHLIEKQRK